LKRGVQFFYFFLEKERKPMKPKSKTWATYSSGTSNSGQSIDDMLNGHPGSTDGPPLPEKIRGSNVALQEKVKALNDPVFSSMNQGSISLIKRSSHQEDVAEPMETMHKRDASRKNLMQRVKKVLIKRKEPEELEQKELVPEQARNNTIIPPTQVALRPRIMRRVEPVTKVEKLPIESLEQHTQRNNQPSLFSTRMEEMNRVSTEVLISMPPPQEILANALKYEALKPAFVGMQTFVSQSGCEYDYPDVPAVCRKVILPFLREAHPRRPEERPCINLDRNPYAHERKTRCISHIISANQLGEEHAFKCREFLIGDVNIRINEALDQGLDPSIHLSHVANYCFLCHLDNTLQASIKHQNASRERTVVKQQEKDYYSPAPQGQEKEYSSAPAGQEQEEHTMLNDTIVILNPFMVMIDQEGEYNRNALLIPDTVDAGIWGPFLLLNPDNYVATLNIPDSGGLKGFFERPEMHFFWPSRVSSQQKNF
jgi:hypothetical protein